MADRIDMVLHCPKCGMQHIDEPNTAAGWDDPPHKSHLCRKEDGGCGTVWRPADVPTNGVQAVSRGENDTWPAGVDPVGHSFEAACREWMKGCSCARGGKPWECASCTEAFHGALLLLTADGVTAKDPT